MHRDEELRFVSIFNTQVFALETLDIAAHQSHKHADAVVGMHHVIPGLQIGVSRFRSFDYLAMPLAWLRSPPAENLTIGQ